MAYVYAIEEAVRLIRAHPLWGRFTRETQRMVLDLMAQRETLTREQKVAALRVVRDAVAADLSNWRG